MHISFLQKVAWILHKISLIFVCTILNAQHHSTKHFHARHKGTLMLHHSPCAPLIFFYRRHTHAHNGREVALVGFFLWQKSAHYKNITTQKSLCMALSFQHTCVNLYASINFLSKEKHHRTYLHDLGYTSAIDLITNCLSWNFSLFANFRGQFRKYFYHDDTLHH